MQFFVQTLKLLLKAGLTIGIIAYLIVQDRLNLSALSLLISEFRFFALILIFTWVGYVPLHAYRWWLFLRALGIQQPFGYTTIVTFIGYFFNTTIPGAVSGDLMKGYYIAQPNISNYKTKIATSLLLDRFTGLFGLAIIASVSLAFNPAWLIAEGAFQPLSWFAIALALGTLFFYGFVIFPFKPEKDPMIKLLGKLPFSTISLRVYLTFKGFEEHRGVLLITLSITLCSHLLVALLFFLVGQMLGVINMDFFTQMLLMPLGLIASSIPLAPAGAGVGHAAFDQLYQLGGFSNGADVFNFYVILQLLAFTVGGILYLITPRGGVRRNSENEP